jgi:homogentisate 1,2-dioxygenase
MIERLVFGDVPRKHHVQLRGDGGALRWEECITRDGFDAAYTIAYHLHRPHEQRFAPPKQGADLPHGWRAPHAEGPEPRGHLAKRHFKSGETKHKGGAPIDARVPLVYNGDIVLSVAFPDRSDPVYFADADADTLIFVHEGKGTLRTMLGDVPFGKDDYVFVPRALVHRFVLEQGVPQHWLVIECRGGLHLPKQFRNEVGQLRMDAPYCHRDFVRPSFVGPMDEGLREVVVKRRDHFHAFVTPHSPLDVVGWDGSVWPWAFPILAFQPRVSSIHLPPTWHGTFAAKGALICSFVPRLVDFAPDAIPCPYPHSSVDVDEILFYVRGNFTSRRGVGPGSISLHPAGIPHGPHPGSYEKSIGSTRTDELAVMLDCYQPFDTTPAAHEIEDANYQDSFVE